MLRDGPPTHLNIVYTVMLLLKGNSGTKSGIETKKLTHKVKPKYTTKDQEDRKYSKKQFKTKIPSSSLYVGYRA